MDTNGYGGRNISKAVSVETSDQNNSKFQLTISGTVETFAQITPKYVSLVGNKDTEVKTVVTIVPQSNYPFKITSTQAEYGKDIRFQLDEVKKDKSSEYQLAVVNLVKEKKRYTDNIILKTDSKVMPEIKIRVYGNIYDMDPQQPNADAKSKFLEMIQKASKEKEKEKEKK